MSDRNNILYSISELRKAFPWISPQIQYHRVTHGFMRLKHRTAPGAALQYSMEELVHSAVVDALAGLGFLEKRFRPTVGIRDVLPGESAPTDYELADPYAFDPVFYTRHDYRIMAYCSLIFERRPPGRWLHVRYVPTRWDTVPGTNRTIYQGWADPNNQARDFVLAVIDIFRLWEHAQIHLDPLVERLWTAQ